MTAIYGDLAASGERNAQVTRDVLAALEQGRNCLVLANWTGHLETLAGLTGVLAAALSKRPGLHQPRLSRSETAGSHPERASCKIVNGSVRPAPYRH